MQLIVVNTPFLEAIRLLKTKLEGYEEHEGGEFNISFALPDAPVCDDPLDFPGIWAVSDKTGAFAMLNVPDDDVSWVRLLFQGVIRRDVRIVPVDGPVKNGLKQTGCPEDLMVEGVPA